MRHLVKVATMVGGGAIALSGVAEAYVVDPNKEPVPVQLPADLDHDFTLALDSENPKIVYYAPKGGRVALMNGMPLLGLALLPQGSALLNVQLEFGVFGTEAQRLLDTIKGAEYIARPWPYVRTKVVPVTPGYDPVNGKPICTSVIDPTNGENQPCSTSIFDSVSYSQVGPSLGEYVALSTVLNKNGAAIFQQFLRSGNAMQLNLEAEYLQAGTAFTAKVIVNFDKVFEQFHRYERNNYWVSRKQVEDFWTREGLCLDRPPSECGVFIEYTNARGEKVTTVTIDPDNKAQQEEMIQVVDRLRDRLMDEFFVPVGPTLPPVDRSKPWFGYRLNQQYERHQRGQHATFDFKSPRGVNYRKTIIPTGVACVVVSDQGDVSRNTAGDCANYWKGTMGFEEIMAKQLTRR
ncbi:hypothetical protein [Sorangium sp. So ce1151]|uniref:hypothetical protein n=1 Tax=Sorangium sp. So ce1151 TaxID=3133332 RepID=UPI003F5EF68D